MKNKENSYFSIHYSRFRFLISVIPIHHILILRVRLDAVVPVTQALPVALIPEQLRITTVRYDVIYIRSFHVPAFLHALHTERMGLQVLFSGFLPLTSVTAAAG